MYEEFLELSNKKTNNLVEQWAKDLKGYLTKEDIQIANKHMKRCFTSYVIRELQIKTTKRYYYTLIRMTKLCNAENSKSL